MSAATLARSTAGEGHPNAHDRTGGPILAANLKAIGRRHADLAEALAAVAPAVNLTFAGAPDGAMSATLDGRQLCSRQRPLEEAERLVQDIDLVEHAVIVVLGFGLGWHVRKLAERGPHSPMSGRMGSPGKATLIVVFEPDLPLLRAVLERIDHSAWLKDALVVFATDPADAASLSKRLEGAESIVAQGVHVVEHPPSRTRLGEAAAEFARTLAAHVAAAKTTLTTTLMRSAETVRNLLLNIDHYVGAQGGAGVSELRDITRRFPAVIVSAGPSLHRNMRQLAEPGVRDRCIIIAVQTTLRPLLAAGIKPHFVTALDYHEISRRFYEGIDPDALRDVTLIADPKAHPVILDAYSGPVRCCANGLLDKLLGPAARDMGQLPAGATVAHLAMYVARFLGCDPIVFIGQDLGFSDGLYYAPGAAIHDTWAPELNPFNTLAMMEWQRIARHRLHLHKTKDVRGRSIFTDAQMQVYLQQFERDFAEYRHAGVTIIDASEGGVAKQHADAMTLRDALDRHAKRPLPRLPLPNISNETAQGAREAACHRVAAVLHDVRVLARLSDEAAETLARMLDDQHDAARMARHFRRIEAQRREVEARFEAFEMINHLNQLGVFRRLKADRRLMMTDHELDPLTKQRLQLERDLDNVRWTADAAREMAAQLAMAQALLANEDARSAIASRSDVAPAAFEPEGDARAVNAQQMHCVDSEAAAPAAGIAALVPIDPERSGLGIRRSLATPFAGWRTVLQATLERLGQSRTIDSIVLLVPDDFDIEPLIDRARIGRSVEIERCGPSPFGPEHVAIAAARLWSDTSWRGGIAGMSVYDEILCPHAMSSAMQKRGLSAALLVGPDWPLVNVTGECGCDEVVRRHLEHAAQHNLVFTQAPPGLCGCVISASLMRELAQRNRLATVGGILTYQPHAPQGDPIARAANVQIEHAVRRSLIRATVDSPRSQALLGRAFEHNAAVSSAEIVRGIEGELHRQPSGANVNTWMPQQITLELCTQRTSCGLFAARAQGVSARPPLSLDLARHIFDHLSDTGDIALTLDGAGDPLLHPHFDEIVRLAKACDNGVRGVHIRTELLVDDRTVLDRLLESGVDVISVDLNADRAATYEAMMGVPRFKDVLLNIEYLLAKRQRLTAQPGTAAIALPWIVPRLQRRAETYEDIDSFFDRWQHMLGTVVIDEPPTSQEHGQALDVYTGANASLTPAVTPLRVIERDQMRAMTIRCDGSMPVALDDWIGADIVGDVRTESLVELWRELLQRRLQVKNGT